MQIPFAHLFVSQMHEEFTYFVQKKERESKPPLASVEHCSDLIWKDNSGHAFIAHNEDSDQNDIGYVVNVCISVYLPKLIQIHPVVLMP